LASLKEVIRKKVKSASTRKPKQGISRENASTDWENDWGRLTDPQFSGGQVSRVFKTERKPWNGGGGDPGAGGTNRGRGLMLLGRGKKGRTKKLGQKAVSTVRNGLSTTSVRGGEPKPYRISQRRIGELYRLCRGMICN